MLLDAYQSAGAVPLDVSRVGVDFATGGSVKWLCGGPGAGWLYVRPDLIEGLDAGARRLASPRPAVRVRAGARGRCRTASSAFSTGTPNVPALYAASAGYDAIEEVGVERIRENSVRQTELLIALLRRRRLRGRLSARFRGTWWDGHRPRAVVRGGTPRARPAQPSSATSAPRRGPPPGPPLLHVGRRASIRRRTDRERSSRPALTSGISAPSRSTDRLAQDP